MSTKQRFTTNGHERHARCLAGVLRVSRCSQRDVHQAPRRPITNSRDRHGDVLWGPFGWGGTDMGTTWRCADSLRTSASDSGMSGGGTPDESASPPQSSGINVWQDQ